MNRSRILNRGIFAFAFLLILPGLALAQSGNSNRQLNLQPVLIYTVSSGTLAGETFEMLVVYSNGTAIWTGTGTGGSRRTSDGVETVRLSQQQVNELLRDLRRAGAFRAGNQASGDNEDNLPLTTITVFFNPSGSGRSLAQTVSFFAPSGSQTRVNDVITNFIDTNFGDGSGT